MTVDIGEDINWTEQRFGEEHDIQCEGERWMSCVQETHCKGPSKQAASNANLVIPWTKTGQEHSVDGNPEQSKIVCKVVDTIVKFQTNDPSHRPLCATIMGCGGTGKSCAINVTISVTQQLTSCNNTVQASAP